ncbi:hypothetical protein [Vibrio phage phiKT1028]|nr:hypothetical protein [Vibrio phage phiKT1028]
MQTLFTGLSSIANASYSYSNVTNLIRIGKFNQEQFEQRVLNTSYYYPHEHPLVQLVEFMQIDPNWTTEELFETIQFKTERWASNADLVGVYNQGRLKRGVLYKEDFSELLISLPPQYDFNEYLTMDDKHLCPFIPVYSESTQLDFRPAKDKPLHPKATKLAVIGVDLMCLAVAYWRYLQDARVYDFDPKPERWLGYPMMNAQILGNRLVVTNALYKGFVTGANPEDLVSVPRTTYVINPMESLFKKHVKDLYRLIQRNPMRNLEHLLGCMIVMDGLPNLEDNPALWKNPGRYALYLRSRWVWNFSYMRTLTLYFHCTRSTKTKNGTLESNVKRWLMQDVKLTTNNIRNVSVANRYEKLRLELQKIIEA